MDQKNDFYHWRYSALSQSTSQHEFVENLIQELGRQRTSLNLVSRVISAYSERDSWSFSQKGFSTESDEVSQTLYDEDSDDFFQIPYDDNSVFNYLADLILLIETIRLQDEESVTTNVLPFSIKNKHLQDDILEILDDSNSLLDLIGAGFTQVEPFRKKLRTVDSKIRRLSRDLLLVQSVEKNVEKEKTRENLSGSIALPGFQERSAANVRSTGDRKPLSIPSFSPNHSSDRTRILIVLGFIAGFVVAMGEGLRPDTVLAFHPLLQMISGSNLWQSYLSPVLLGFVIALSVSVLKTLFSVTLLLFNPTQKD